MGHWDFSLFTSTFALVFLAELPDKTAFATLMMATRQRPSAVFLGVALAFVVQSLVAVLFGSLLGLLPVTWVRMGAALLFLGFGVAMWLRRDAADSELASGSSVSPRFWATVLSSFIVIFLAEWGDLTQLATAALQAKYQNPFTIFLGATLALWSVTLLAIVLGHHSRRVIKPAVLQRLAALAFAGVGVFLLFGIHDRL